MNLSKILKSALFIIALLALSLKTFAQTTSSGYTNLLCKKWESSKVIIDGDSLASFNNKAGMTYLKNGKVKIYISGKLTNKGKWTLDENTMILSITVVDKSGKEGPPELLIIKTLTKNSLVAETKTGGSIGTIYFIPRN